MITIVKQYLIDLMQELNLFQLRHKHIYNEADDLFI
jgi:hypothetical protein